MPTYRALLVGALFAGMAVQQAAAIPTLLLLGRDPRNAYLTSTAAAFCAAVAILPGAVQ